MWGYKDIIPIAVATVRLALISLSKTPAWDSRKDFKPRKSGLSLVKMRNISPKAGHPATSAATVVPSARDLYSPSGSCLTASGSAEIKVKGWIFLFYKRVGLW